MLTIPSKPLQSSKNKIKEVLRIECHHFILKEGSKAPKHLQLISVIRRCSSVIMQDRSTLKLDFHNFNLKGKYTRSNLTPSNDTYYDRFSI